MAKRVRSNRVTFTLNNYTEDDIEALISYADQKEGLEFIVMGLEIGEQGTAHVQGFINLNIPNKEGGIKFWKAELPCGARMHFETARGTDQQNRVYCTKEGPFYERGTPCDKGPHQKIFEAAKISVEDAVAMDYEFGMRCYSQLKAIHADFNRPKAKSDITELYDWQKKAIDMLENQDNRKILFIVDEEGGKGKSELCKYLMSKGDAWACQGKILVCTVAYGLRPAAHGLP